MSSLSLVLLVMGIMFILLMIWAFTFDQKKWDKKQEESRYTADGDWRERDIIKEYKDKIKEKVKKW